ncbi:MAG: uracil-DNA glycosylase [Pseudomonadota bacterium]
MDNAALRSILEFYRDAGVDAAIGEEPVDRFDESKRDVARKQADQQARADALAAQIAPPPGEAPPVIQAAQPLHAAKGRSVEGIEAAQALAARAQSLDELRQALEAFDGCALKKTARRLVFSDGNPKASIMLIGEAPGREEDERGLPFVGRSGQLLDKMLAAIDLDRSSVYIGNAIYWRPPGNRTPTAEERALCEPFIRRQIVLAQPKVLMTLGGSALSSLFGIQGIMKTRGRTLSYEYDGLTIPSVPTLHPAALLRTPSNKRLAWQDFLALERIIDETGARQ